LSALPPPPSFSLSPYTTLFRSSTGPYFLSSDWTHTSLQVRSAPRSVHPEGLLSLLSSHRLPLSRYIRCTLPSVHTDNKTSAFPRSEEHTSELQSRFDLVCRLLL